MADVAPDRVATTDVLDASSAAADTGLALTDVLDAFTAPRDVADAGDAPTLSADVRDTPSDASPAQGGDVAQVDAPAPGPQDAAPDGSVDRVGAVPPDFMLPDLNPASASHRMTIIPSAQRGTLSVWYFASAT